MWKAPSRWPAGIGVGGRTVGLEFCATLLTNCSISSFSCVLLRPSGGGGVGFGGMHEEAYRRDARTRERLKRGGRRQEDAPGNRLYCIIGSDNGFVQAWEMSLVGEEGIGGQSLWSQKVCVAS